MYFKFAAEKRFKLFLQAERKSEPPHIRGISSLPEIDDALKIILRVVVFILCISFGFGSRNPVSTEEDVTVTAVKVTHILLGQSNKFFIFQNERFHCLKVYIESILFELLKKKRIFFV